MEVFIRKTGARLAIRRAGRAVGLAQAAPTVAALEILEGHHRHATAQRAQVPTRGIEIAEAIARHRIGHVMQAHGRAQFMQRLAQAGVPEEAVNVQPVTANPRWDQYGSQVGFSLDQGLTVIAENGGSELEAIALDPGPLLESGIVLQYSRLEYFFSGIDELKRMLDDELRSEIVSRLKDAGFTYVTLDLQGYRTGSMNEVLPADVRFDHSNKND